MGRLNSLGESNLIIRPINFESQNQADGKMRTLSNIAGFMENGGQGKKSRQSLLEARKCKERDVVLLPLGIMPVNTLFTIM